MLRTFPTDLINDPVVIAAAAAAGITTDRLAQILSRATDEQLRGMLQHVVKPSSWGLSAADWRAAFSIPASVTDQEIGGLMHWMDGMTAAIAYDPGT